jgi:3-hydroxyisobutyrate dehydrogenase
MGYRMAKNLREKLPETDTLLINDVNKDAVSKFVEELKGFTVIVTDSPREVAEKAVCLFTLSPISRAHFL